MQAWHLSVDLERDPSESDTGTIHFTHGSDSTLMGDSNRGDGYDMGVTSHHQLWDQCESHVSQSFINYES